MAGQHGKVIGKYTTGSDVKPFTGIFDGNGFAILNLSLSGEALFSYVGETGIVRNLTLQKAQIEDTQNSSSHHPAALVAYNKGTVEHCMTRGTTVVSKFNSPTGGLVGRNEGTIRLCGVDGGSVAIQNSFNTKAGGFVGRNLGQIDQCFTSASVSGNKWAGGFVGGQEGGTISNCYATGQVTATGEQAGGFAGFFITYDRDNPSVLQNVYAANNVQAQTGGPLVGGNASSIKEGEGNATNCYYNVYKTAPVTLGMAQTGANGMTTGQMKQQAFAALLGGTDTWAVDTQDGDIRNNGYPFLQKVAPLPAAQSEEPIEVNLLIASYDPQGYAFAPGTVLTVQATGEPVTVKDVLDAAQAKGLLQYEATYSANTGYFVKAINGVEPSAPGGWMFTVNDELSSVGMAATQVMPGDRVLWYEGTASNHYTAPTWQEMTAPAPEPFIEIENKAQLLALANSQNTAQDWSKHYRLTADIDLADEDFSPIGNEATPFTGIFDGNGKTISHLTIARGAGSQNLGLFGVIQNAQIVNLTLADVQVTGGSHLGTLVGVAKADPEKGEANLIGNCHATGTLRALGTSVIKQTDAGGLVGINEGGAD